MTESHLRSPQDDLQQRRPVWDALSMLFLDTQLDDADFAYMAKVLARSPYTDAELATIYHAEVEPVCRVNIGMAPGYWSGFPDGWIEERILSRGLDAARALPKLRSSGEPIAWGWGGLQQRFLELRGRGGSRNKP
ncbi:MAG TPA: hypothetical protein VGD58_05560 [Herpetosiphonaceae bacterium]